MDIREAADRLLAETATRLYADQIAEARQRAAEWKPDVESSQTVASEPAATSGTKPPAKAMARHAPGNRAAAKEAFEAYDSGWNGVEVYINTRSMEMYNELERVLQARITEARREGWLGEIAGLEATLEAATQKLQAMQQIAARHGTTHIGMPSFRDTVGRTST